MSLVIAFCGMHGAVMAGDHREIIFCGDAPSVALLEAGLSSNAISSLGELRKYALGLGVAVTVNDSKSKVCEKEGLLIGEVTETDGSVVKRRRLCVSCGNYIIGETTGSGWIVRSRGQGSNFLVLGNQATKDIAGRAIRDYWKKEGGTLPDAVRVILLAMQEAAERTASVSRTCTLLQTRRKVPLTGAFPC